MRIFYKNLIQLFLHPTHGWEDVENDHIDASIPARKGLFPLILLAALTVFVEPLYHSHVPLMKLIIRFVATISMYFPTYFLGSFLLTLFLGPSLTEPLDENRCRMLALYTIGLESALTVLYNCLPFLNAFLYFLPVYVAIIQWKALDYMHVRPERAGHYMMLAVLGVLIPPYIIYFLFSLL